jgi:hypothetical protein
LAWIGGKKNCQIAALDQRLAAGWQWVARRSPMIATPLARGVQQPVALRLDRPITLTGAFPQTLDVNDFDVPAAVADKARLLKCVSHDRHGVAPHADHLRQEFLSKRQSFAAA